MLHIQVGAYAALAFRQEGLQAGEGGVFHHGQQIGGAKHRQGAGTDGCGSEFFGDRLLDLAPHSDHDHRCFLLFLVKTAPEFRRRFG